MKIAIILGTRPEIIKMSPIIRECVKRNLDFFILHTGQHYSYKMDALFFEKLDLPDPTYNLEIGSNSHAIQTGNMLIKMEPVLKKERPDIVLVQGDTNTVLAGALTASKLGISIGHVEAGLRSYDNAMPEEINRVLTDHCSDYLFTPTHQSEQILINEGIASDKIFVTGNTIVDALYQHIQLAETKSNIISELQLEPNKYILVTAHRQENVDDKDRFQGILTGLQKCNEYFDVPIIYPIHPRSMKNIEKFNLSYDGIYLIEPVDFLDFLQLEKHASLIITDSGGIQEESCILQKPCVTTRNNTERPETIDVKANVLSGADPDRIMEHAKMMVKKSTDWNNPFGDGRSAERIITILEEHLG